MSVLESLKSIQNKPYTAVYSGRLTVDKPKIKVLTPTLKENASPVKTSRQNNNTSTKVVKKANVNFDNESVASTNISLLSLDSIDYKRKIDYGKVDHFSPYETLTNRRVRKKMREYRSLINTCLKQYIKYLNTNISDDDLADMGLYDLLDHDEMSKLYDLDENETPRPPKAYANSVAAFDDLYVYERNTLANFRKLKNKRKYGIRRNRQMFKRHSLEMLKDLESVYFIDSTFKKQQRTLRIESSKGFSELNMAEMELEDDDDDDGDDEDDDDEYSYLFKDEPEMVMPKVFEKSKVLKYSSTDKRQSELSEASDMSGVSRRSRKYDRVKSQLKAYINSGSPTLTSEFVQQRRKMTAIRRHLLTSIIENKKFKIADTKLKYCDQLDLTIREENRLHQGPTYLLPLTSENVENFSYPKTVQVSDKYVHLYEWLKVIDKTEEFDDIDEFSNDSLKQITSQIYPQSGAIHKSDDNLILSVLKYNTASVTSIIGKKSKTPNIASTNIPTNNVVLPKLKVQIKPPLRNESTYYSFNDKLVLDLVMNYKKIKEETETNEKLKNSEFNKNDLNVAILSPEAKLVVRERLKRAKLKHNLLLSEMKLDSFIF